ncbi:MAG: site-specific DNA-methyltransferase [Candidatus Gracilibacteria bacterium]
MPELNWVGKEAVKNHDKEVPFRLLKKVPSVSVGEKSENLIIHGDNLEALKALMPYYKGKIKCIYIDPPYNTGNEGWVYNDKTNSPKIKKWLGKVVGGESEDLSRHDKWLCMMYPRLNLLRNLLSDDGSIYISIDDNEQANLKNILDEIFGKENFVTNLIWQKKYTQSNDAKYYSNTHDFIVVYAKSLKSLRLNHLERTDEQNARYKNPDNDPLGLWMTQPLHAKSGSDTSYVFTFSNGVEWKPPAGTFPRYAKNTLVQADKENRIWFGRNKTAVPRMKKYLSEMREGVIPRTIWLYDEVGSNDDAKRDIKKLFDNNPFESPKPVSLIKRIIQLASNPGDLILDSFAGSGTTGHATMDLNQDGGDRKFIMVEMEDKVAKDITAQRVKRAIEKYGYKESFEYCELDKPLFDETGQIDESCTFEQLATYIYFTETHTNITKKIIKENFIGEFSETEYYLLFKGKDKNTLDEKFIKNLGDSGKKKVIYADRCLADSETLEKYNVVFKQIPYEIERY